MTVSSKKGLLEQVRPRTYLNKDFDSMKADLLRYARTHFPETLRDFSEASLGGLLLDMAAMVGDVQSFYLDHQFHETFSDTAVELRNIERHINKAGVDIVGASPAVVLTTFMVQVPATGNPPTPEPSALPIIHQGTVVPSSNGTLFELTEDLDFRLRDPAGNLRAAVEVSSRNASNVPTSFVIKVEGECISGFQTTDTFSVGAFQPFKRFTLSKENVTEVKRIVDGLGNEYHQVDFLTQDTVYKAITNAESDATLVPATLVPTPAPFRYLARTSLETRLTTITFGGGSGESLNDDVIPDPSEFAVPLFGKKVFTRFSLDPGQLLQTSTLGVLQPNTSLLISYRHGGGLSHNVGERAIRGVRSLIMSFPESPRAEVSQFVRQSVDATNYARASGGEDPPSVDELRQKIPAIKSSQSRIVSKQDLLARVYTMPSNFGRVFRASIQPDPNNPLAGRLFIISRDATSKLIVSPDSLKKNLVRYLAQFRLFSDAIDILDAQVINLTVHFSLVVDPTFAANLVLQSVLAKLNKFFNVKNFDIDQPIVLSEIQNVIFNGPGVLSVNGVELRSITGVVGVGSGARVYTNNQFDVQSSTDRGIVFPPPGGIFEVRYKQHDIIGSVV